MSDARELFGHALERTQAGLLVNEGRIYKAFDDLGVGIPARTLADWYHEAGREHFGELSGQAFGMALTVAIMAVEADRRRAKEQQSPHQHAARWERSAEWQERLDAMPRPDTVVELVCWNKPPLHALVGRDLLPGDEQPRWHLSVSHDERVPTWDELVSAAHELRPGVVFCVGLPPRSWWLNFAENVLHLHEIRDQPLIDSWAALRRGDTPT